jgi:hypothetical protein
MADQQADINQPPTLPSRSTAGCRMPSQRMEHHLTPTPHTVGTTAGLLHTAAAGSVGGLR